MSLKKYFSKVGSFFRSLWGYKPNISKNQNKTLEYEALLSKIYDNFSVLLNRAYRNYSKEKFMLDLMPPRESYKRFFSEEVKQNFDIYENNVGGISGRRKTLESYVN